MDCHVWAGRRLRKTASIGNCWTAKSLQQLLRKLDFYFYVRGLQIQRGICRSSLQVFSFKRVRGALLLQRRVPYAWLARGDPAPTRQAHTVQSESDTEFKPEIYAKRQLSMFGICKSSSTNARPIRIYVRIFWNYESLKSGSK